MTDLLMTVSLSDVHTCQVSDDERPQLLMGGELHTHRDTHTETHTQRHTQRQRHTHRDTHTETHTQRHTHTETHTHTHTHRDTHTDTHTHTHMKISSVRFVRSVCVCVSHPQRCSELGLSVIHTVDRDTVQPLKHTNITQASSDHIKASLKTGFYWKKLQHSSLGCTVNHNEN